MSTIDEILYGDGKSLNMPGLIMVSPSFAAIFGAEEKHYGRDWRRIKRETRKALLKARKAEVGCGISNAPNSFWRNQWFKT